MDNVPTISNFALFFNRCIYLRTVNIAVHELDKFCLSETYLNPSAAPDDGNFEIQVYNSVRSDNSSNISME